MLTIVWNDNDVLFFTDTRPCWIRCVALNISGRTELQDSFTAFRETHACLSAEHPFTRGRWCSADVALGVDLLRTIEVEDAQQ